MILLCYLTLTIVTYILLNDIQQPDIDRIYFNSYFNI